MTFLVGPGHENSQISWRHKNLPKLSYSMKNAKLCIMAEFGVKISIISFFFATLSKWPKTVKNWHFWWVPGHENSQISWRHKNLPKLSYSMQNAKLCIMAEFGVKISIISASFATLSKWPKTVKNWHFWWVPGHENSQISWCHKNLPKLSYSMQNAKLCIMAEFGVKISIISASFATLSKWPKTVKNWHFWWVPGHENSQISWRHKNLPKLSYSMQNAKLCIMAEFGVKISIISAFFATLWKWPKTVKNWHFWWIRGHENSQISWCHKNLPKLSYSMKNAKLCIMAEFGVKISIISASFATLSKWPKTVKNWHFWWVRGHENSQISWCHKNLPKLSYSMQNAKLCIMAEFGVKISIISASFATLSKWPKTVKNWHFWWVPGHENSQISWRHKNLPKLSYSMQNAKLCIMAEFGVKISIISAFFATLSKWPKTVKNWHFWWVPGHENSQISWRHKNLPKLSYSMQNAKLCIMAEFGVKISIISASFATLSKWPKTVKNWHFWWVPGHENSQISWRHKNLPKLSYSMQNAKLCIMAEFGVKISIISAFFATLWKWPKTVKNWHFWWIRGHENSQISWCHKNLPKLSYSMKNAKLCIMAEFGVKISIISAYFATLSKWPKTVKNWHFWWIRGHDNSQISWCHKNLPKLSYSMQNAKLCIMAEFGVKISIISASFATLSKWPKTVKNWHFWWVPGHENSQISWRHKNLPKLSYSMQNAKLCIMAEFGVKISIISAFFATLSKWPKTVKNWHFWWVRGHENSQISWCHKNLPKLSYSMQNAKLCIMAEFGVKISIISAYFATLSKWPKTVKNWHFWWVPGHENSQISWRHKNLPKLSYSMQNAKLCIMAEFGVKISIISAFFATLWKWPKTVKNWHFWWIRGHENSQISWCHKNLPKLSYSMKNAKLCIMAEFGVKISIISASFATLSKWPKTVKNWHFWWVPGHENSQISWRHKNLPKLSYSMQNAKLCIMAEFGVKISIISASFATLSKWPKTVKNWHFWWVPGHENSQISWRHKNLPKLSYSMQNAKLCIMAEFGVKISIISAFFATLSKWPKTVKNWHFWWVQVMKILKFLDVIKTYQNYLIRCRMPNYASWPNLAWKSPLLVPLLLLCQNDLKQWKIDIFGGSRVMKILKFLDVIKTYQNYLIRCRMPNYASWPNLAWKSPLLVLFLLLCQNDLKQWKIDIFGGSRVMKILKFLDVIKTYQNYLIRWRMPNYASWPNLAWKSPLLVPLLLLCQNDLKQWKIDIFGGSRVMKILKFLDVIKTYQNYLIRCRMPNYASWPNLAWKSPLLVPLLLLCQNDLKQWKIDIFGGSRVMKILKFLDVIKTYQNYLIRCRMPNYASWPNLAWKSPLLVPILLLCQNDLKQWKIDIFGGSRVMKILKFLENDLKQS